MGAFHQRVFKTTPTAVLVEFLFTEWIVINEYLNKWKKRKKQYTLLVSTGWTMLVYQLLRAEREEGGRGLICLQLQELVIDYLWLYPLVIFTMLRTSLSMPEKGNIFISKQSIASRRVLLSVSMKICLSISRLYVLRRMDWDGSYFLLKIWLS